MSAIPEKILLYKVLERAILDVCNAKETIACIKISQADKRRAHYWLFESIEIHYCSFLNICTELDLDFNVLRKTIWRAISEDTTFTRPFGAGNIGLIHAALDENNEGFQLARMRK